MVCGVEGSVLLRGQGLRAQACLSQHVSIGGKEAPVDLADSDGLTETVPPESLTVRWPSRSIYSTTCPDFRSAGGHGIQSPLAYLPK